VRPLREYVVPLVVLVTALAAGVALGGGPLSDLGRTPPPAAAEPPRAPATDPATTRFTDGFAGQVAASLYAHRLQGRQVAVLTLPGADPDVVQAIAAEIPTAGGGVLGPSALKQKLVDPQEKSLVDTLGEQLVTQLGSGVTTADATTYERIGQLIARALARNTKKDAMEAAKVSSLRASLQGAGLLGVPADAGDPPTLAPLVLVVTGRAVEVPVRVGLAEGLAAVAKGVVVAGPTGDAGVVALRAAPPTRPVATVDGTDVPAGRVSAVLTLAHVLRSPGGSFGASGTDGMAPLG
jgi:hypothetical protein